MRRLLLLVFTSAALLVPSHALAVAADDDPLTEGGTHDVRTQSANDYTARSNQGCSIEREDGSLAVSCNRGDYLWLEYTFRVPERAIDLRPRPDHAVMSSGDDGYFDVEGWREGKRYRASVVVSNKIKVRIDALDLRLRLPDRRDNRRCVTRGEWATVVPQLGGSGGTRSEVRTTFDTDGKLVRISSWIDGFRHQTRAYRKCGGGKYRIGYHQYRGDPWWSYWG